MPISEVGLQNAYARYFFCVFDASLRQDDGDCQLARENLEDFLADDVALAPFPLTTSRAELGHT
jgi:hypothetical protein